MFCYYASGKPGLTLAAAAWQAVTQNRANQHAHHDFTGQMAAYAAPIGGPKLC
jgi:hypothetical protein